MIHPVWPIKMIMGTADIALGKIWSKYNGEVTENVVLRLVFHDCIPYMDGTGKYYDITQGKNLFLCIL